VAVHLQTSIILHSPGTRFHGAVSEDPSYAFVARNHSTISIGFWMDAKITNNEYPLDLPGGFVINTKSWGM